MVYNLLEELDIPGEWYYDKDNKKIYFYPKNKIDSDSALEVSENDKSLITLENCENVIIDDVNIVNGRGAGILCTNVNNVDILGCTIKNMGSAGVIIGNSTNTRVENNEIANVGANGISIYNIGDNITLTPGNITVKNNRIHDMGQVSRSYTPGVSASGAVGVKITNNEIYNGPHSAIIFSGSEIEVIKNDIHNVLTEASDSGAIYTGRSYVYRGNKINNNFIHDIYDNAGGKYSVHAIYLDDMGSGYEVKSNIIINVPSGIFLNGGRDNNIENNIIAHSTYSSEETFSMRMRDTGLFDFRLADVETLVQEISLLDLSCENWQKYPEVNDYLPDAPGAPIRNIVKNNVIWDFKPIEAYDNYLKYSPLGVNMDNAADPMFVNEAEKNYNLNPESPVFSYLPEFEDIDFDKIGIEK